MALRLISECLTEDAQLIIEEKEDGKKNYFIEGIFLQGAIKNRNGRVYPVGVLENEVKRYSEQYIKGKRAFGELGHPQGPGINLDRVSHMVESLTKDGNNFIGRAKVLDTPMGNIVKNLMDEGATLGVSSRGMGSLKQNNEGVDEVQDDFYLATAADIVADPSAPDAFVRGIMEGVEWVWDGGILKQQTIQELKNEIVKTSKRDLKEAKIRVFERFMKHLSSR
ncbi:MAG: primosomal protein [Proteobacteria bacterium]|jgi:hypothetical protein|nr:primosomal protein [Pseudomonadota bacterium]